MLYAPTEVLSTHSRTHVCPSLCSMTVAKWSLAVASGKIKRPCASATGICGQCRHLRNPQETIPTSFMRTPTKMFHGNSVGNQLHIYCLHFHVRASQDAVPEQSPLLVRQGIWALGIWVRNLGVRYLGLGIWALGIWVR